MVVIGELEEHGHQFEVANSFQAALMSLEQKVPDLIVIDASLEFSSTNALMYIRNMFDGKIAVYGERISPATSQLLSHLGVSIIVRSITSTAEGASSTMARVSSIACENDANAHTPSPRWAGIG